MRYPQESLLSHQQLLQWLTELAPESARGLAMSLEWLTPPCPQLAVFADRVCTGEVKVKGGHGVGLLPQDSCPYRKRKEHQHAPAFPIHRIKAMRGHGVANYKTERPYQEQLCPQCDLKPSLLHRDTTNTS